ncbi:NEAT domain-containing protein [Mammaliicoccus lentus]|uniref:NEAT domain-containing protein n=1 Tax=Mammaliicoccus lentus TaxID=42858 RepID=UPI001E5E048A|nr:NEAT domain-containing protein [Mammaliicoccus lentus]MCD2477506.1 NEAT domain-containing protein [Mammaliicoccus lentus]MCD2521123.1 NEAT domain-containing protein [Mammaliicoccus lentus]
MKKGVKSLLAFSLIFSTFSYTSYEPQSHTAMNKAKAAETTTSEKENITIDYTVSKDTSDEVSYMDQYMEKPAKVSFENGETYVEVTLKSASYWKSFELLDGADPIDVQTVSEDKDSDTKVIKFKVKPGTKKLTSKVHIVVPAVNYDNKYTTYVNFKEAIPEAPTSTEQPSPEEPEDSKDKNYLEDYTDLNVDLSSAEERNFTVLKEDGSNTSSMDRQMEKPGKIANVNGQKMFVTTITSQQFWTDFQVKIGDSYQRVTPISVDGNKKVVMFPLVDNQYVYDAKVSINAPGFGIMKHGTQIKIEEPSTEEPSTEEPSTEEPSTEEPSTEEPSTEEPSTEESSTEKPSTEEPSPEEPSTDKPSINKPEQPSEDDNKPITKEEVPIPDEVKKPTGSNHGSTNQEKATSTLGYNVYKEGSSEISYMDQYMEKPAQVLHENGKTYLQLTLKNASYWKSFDLYDGNKKLNVQTVSEDKSADIKVIKFEAKPGTKSLTSKVHIVVSAIGYDNKYTTEIKFDSAVPKPDGSKAEDSNETDNPTTKPSESNTGTSMEQSHQKSDTTKKPKAESGQITRDYKVYKEKSNEISYMDQYMVKPARIVEKDGKRYVEITLKSASYWKSFDLYDNGKRINVETVSEDKSADTKVIRFVEPNNLKELTSKVHIIVPAINYDNHYTTRIVFDKEVTNGKGATSGQNNEAGSSDSNTGGSSHSDNGNTTDGSNGTTDSGSSTNDGGLSSSNTGTNAMSGTASNASSGNSATSATDKSNPAFDRNADGSSKDGANNMKLINPSTSSNEDIMTYALIFGGAVLLLAGSFFIARKRATK